MVNPTFDNRLLLTCGNFKITKTFKVIKQLLAALNNLRLAVFVRLSRSFETVFIAHAQEPLDDHQVAQSDKDIKVSLALATSQ